MKHLFSFTSVILILFSCSSTINNKHLENLQENSITQLRTNLEFLASDELQGRQSTKEGAKIAAQFLATRLKQYGIYDMGRNISLALSVPFVLN